MQLRSFFDEYADSSFARGIAGRSYAIIGGGFYGCVIALYLDHFGGRVTLFESDDTLLMRASYNNQARIHQGYHYPRSMITGVRCVANFQKFCQIFASSVYRDFVKLYGIARRDSLVSAAQFQTFCERIGAPLKTAPKKYRQYFDPELVEEVFETQEYAFDAVKLRQMLLGEFETSRVALRYSTRVERLSQRADGRIAVELFAGGEQLADEVFACGYSQLNTLLRRSALPLLPLKHEVAEMSLVRVPRELQELGITIMDGPYFSLMPFPAEQLHSFSHVRYTPHESWQDALLDRDPERYMQAQTIRSNFVKMRQDALRYVPLVRGCEYVRSLVQTKTVLTRNERNDGRPILLRRNYAYPGLNLVLGGKIDNIFDVCQAMATSPHAMTANS